ncbi:cupin domain-containing protein [Halopseudomonas laoshanensis]|uniref:cupin domain-containing protein n=1 Tax=Halopseudomonas laoshanensis TaxID=2268758 RepID=UPI0015B5AC63|nr:cupin domain-containing protein [Halopseudomonas laoshanensis]
MSSSFTPLNMDRRLAVLVRPGDQHWLDAPQAPVRRWPLEREAPESGEVTSLVEYLPGARFPEHRHPNGEEILVLSGVFSDEGGDYPAGSYLRSPAASRHSPFSQPGCQIFVKLNQFAQGDMTTLRLGPQQMRWQTLNQGMEQAQLHTFANECSSLQRYAKTMRVPLPEQNRGEILVLEGSLTLNDEPLPAGSWLRAPSFDALCLTAAENTLILVKTQLVGDYQLS